jgi:hypothetical protein
MENILIILTATVNVNYNKFFLYQTNTEERLFYYNKSIIQWLEKTNLRICVVENSGYTFPELDSYKELYRNRFEIISFLEQDIPVEKRSLICENSKGSSEIYAINYAFENSKFKDQIDFIIKITCRYFIPELENYLYENDISLKSKGGISVFDNSNIILGLRQGQDHRCEIVGSHVKAMNIIFDPKMFDANYTYNLHIDSVYYNRINLFNPKNILFCKKLDIDPTPIGGINRINDNL